MRLPFARVMTPREVSRHASRWAVKLGVVSLISCFNLAALRKPVAGAGAESSGGQRRSMQGGIQQSNTQARDALKPSQASTIATPHAIQLGHIGTAIPLNMICHPANARASCSSAMVAKIVAGSFE